MNAALAIARLTFWEAVRMRIVLVFILVLAFLLLLMPGALRGDDTVTGRLQTFLSYSLSAVTIFLGVATVFLSCATLSNELRYNQIHLVLTKPVARFQVLLGKWLGVMALNFVLVTLCAISIYAFARLIKAQKVGFERDRINLNDVIWTARAAAQPIKPEEEWRQRAAQEVIDLAKSGAIAETGMKAADEAMRANAFKERLNQAENDWRMIADGQYRDFRFERLIPPGSDDEAMQIRFKARGLPLPLMEILYCQWEFVDPTTGYPITPAIVTEERAAQRHQFLIRGKQLIKDGKAVLRVTNPLSPNDPVKIFFADNNSLEILYKVDTFEANFVRAVTLIFLQLAFLAAMGLFFSTFVSFPVACLCTFTVYLIGVAHPFWMESIGANMQMFDADVDPYGRFGPFVRQYFLVPFLHVFPDFVAFSGGGKLVDGEVISYTLLGQGFGRMLAFSGVVLLTVGWFIFSRREIAAVQV